MNQLREMHGLQKLFMTRHADPASVYSYLDAGIWKRRLAIIQLENRIDEAEGTFNSEVRVVGLVSFIPPSRPIISHKCIEGSLMIQHSSRHGFRVRALPLKHCFRDSRFDIHRKPRAEEEHCENSRFRVWRKETFSVALDSRYNVLSRV